MSIDEIKYFLKFIWNEIKIEILAILKSLTNLARPKLWLAVFTFVLFYQLAIVRGRIEAIITLILILFIWMWDTWEAGHWRGQMRKERVERAKRLKKK